MGDGLVLAGRYEIGALLGRGGMAEVRAGWDRRLGRAVAVKTLLPGLAEEASVRQRFEGEGRAAARLAHPNAVAVFDVGEDGGVPYLVMEQVLGPSLEEEMGGGPLDAGRVVRLGEELLAALGAAHRAGLIHRDVKPANVLMTLEGSAKVADFGIAKAVAGEEGVTLQADLTSAGQMLGTVAYMAPERLAGGPASIQSDLYSVGVVLYEALTGTRPFAAPTPVGVVRAIDEARPPPLRACLPHLDTALAGAVERAMAKEPGDRFASADEMAAALRDTGDATVISMVGPPTELLDVPAPAEPAHHTPRVSRARLWLFALLALGGLAVVLTAIAVRSDEPTSPVTTTATSPPSTVVTPAPTETPAPTLPITRATQAPPRKGKGKK